MGVGKVSGTDIDRPDQRLEYTAVSDLFDVDLESGAWTVKAGDPVVLDFEGDNVLSSALTVTDDGLGRLCAEWPVSCEEDPSDTAACPPCPLSAEATVTVTLTLTLAATETV